ncbi:hypothetical protein ACHAQH_003569 [Verticillium albo-atrum]
MLKSGLVVVALLSIAFQVFLKDAVWMGFGIGRTIQPLSEFPYTCRRIEDPQVEACEDMWLSETTRQLFLACSDSTGRSSWMPNGGRFDPSGRSQRDAIVALDLDLPRLDATNIRSLKTPGYTGTVGDELLNLAGFTGFESTENGENRVTLLAVNNRPPIDASTGKAILGPGQVGANSTIEVFETGAHATELRHVRTHADGGIATPNRVAALAKDLFYITNDHGQDKVGFVSSHPACVIQKSALTWLHQKHHLGLLMNTGDVTVCTAATGCEKVADNLRFPNGLAHDRNGLLYVPSAATGVIHVFKILKNNSIEQVDEIRTGYSIDNVSVDQNGDVFVAAFPIGLGVLKAFNDPRNSFPPAAVLRLRKGENGYDIEKVLEDAHSEVLPAATTALHDAKTGRLFLSSVVSPFIAVCEPKS